MGYEQAWLNYENKSVNMGINDINVICADVKDEIIKNSVKELQMAFKGMTGQELKVENADDKNVRSGSIRLTVKPEMQEEIKAEGYRLL